MSDRVCVRGITHAFGTRKVLDDVSFAARDGELVAIVGPSGCGKSTLLRILAGLQTPDAGEAIIDGASTIGVPGRAGYMPQADTLLPWRRALANAILGAEVRGIDRSDAAERAAGMFVRFGLGGFEEAWPSQLSGGMRQRVALLRTVLTDASVLLLDEPFGALDAITRHDLQAWLGELLAQTGGTTTLLVTHDIDEALRLADTVLVMSRRPGRILTNMPVDEPRPRSLERLTRDDFATMKRALLQALSDR